MKTIIFSLWKIARIYFIALFAPIVFFSCADAITDSSNTESKLSDDGKTYLSLNIASVSSERTIAPDTTDFAVTNLTDITLKGKPSDAAGDEQTLATAETYSLIDSKLIPIEEAGNWTFTLTAKMNGVGFTGTAEKAITSGTTNTIEFVLEADVNYGGLSIKMTFKGNLIDSSGYKVVVKLSDENKSTIKDEKTFLPTNEGDITPSSTSSTNTSFYVTYERNISDESSRLESGTYHILFEFYNTLLSATKPLNTSRNFIRIEKGIVTTAELSIDLNEVYTIEYNDNEGTVASGGTKVLNYSPKSGVELPKMTPPETTQFFAGWYTDSAFAAGTKVSVVDGDKLMLAKDTSGNLTLYARYCSASDSNLYVDSENGQEGADGLSTGTAVPTFASAISLLQNYAKPADWTIHIIGTLEGAQEISSAITMSEATSLAITGSDGSDSLDAGGSGTTLTIGTAVPVTITNLTITGGDNTEGEGKGGGIYIAEGATVKLGDGAVVSGNSAKNGGGVYNEGTFFMYGTAVIGDSNVESEAVSGDTSGTTTWSNRSNGGNGGGICSKKSTSSVYLGYSGFEEDGVTLVETELTGGVYHNYSTGDWTSGGGICIENSAKLYMDSGNICYNTAIGRPGGGVAAYSDDGDFTMFTMSGGSISHNKCDGYGANEGGGGVRIDAAFTMSGGEICNNEAPVGAGISLTASGTINITGGSIKENVGTSANSINKESETQGTITIKDTSYTESIVKNILNGTLAFGTKLSTEEKAVGDIVFNDGSAIAYADGLSLSDAQKGAAIAVIFYVGTGEATIGTNENILGQKILGVGLKNTKGLAWAPTTSYGYEATFDGCARENSAPTGSVYYTYTVDQGGTERNYYLTGSSYFDGSDSWDGIQEAETNSGKDDWRTEENYPAFYWVMKYTTTYSIPEDSTKMWYLPSVVELRCLYDSITSITTVSAALTAVGGDPLDATDYWSCSQNTNQASQAWAVGFSDGVVYSDCGKNYTGDEGHDTIGVCAIRQF